MTELPPPPVPADADLRDLPSMPLDVIRVRDSDLALTAAPEVFRVAVLAWCASWHQVPAGSLPGSDHQLARLLGFRDSGNFARFRQAGKFRGWVLHADGRYYHPVVVEKVLERLAYRGSQGWAPGRKGRQGQGEQDLLHVVVPGVAG